MMYEVWVSKDRQHVGVGWNLNDLLKDHAIYVSHISADNHQHALTRGKAMIDQLNQPRVLSRVEALLARFNK